jgi:23S rRNA (guanosine2251-2'-O)-methyltransferase
MIKLGAVTLRNYTPTPKEISSIRRNPIYIIIDNVLDTYNVGAIFRLADAAAAAGIYLVGTTDTPDDPKVGHKIQKASVGVWRWTYWEHADTVGDAVRRIVELPNHRTTKISITKFQLQTVAIEQTPDSVPYNTFDYQLPLAIIVGHETSGVSAEGLQVADVAVEIPMYGVNKSLNVMVSLAIVLWEVLKSAK